MFIRCQLGLVACYLLATTVTVFGHVSAYKKFGQDCRDISCAVNEHCIVSHVACEKDQRDGEHCGLYPRCVERPLSPEFASGTRHRRSPQMIYPPPIPVSQMPPLAVAPITRQVQPRQAQPRNPYLSLSLNYPAYPAYLYPNNGLPRARQVNANNPGYYNPIPRYYSYNIYVNLPFSDSPDFLDLDSDSESFHNVTKRQFMPGPMPMPIPMPMPMPIGRPLPIPGPVPMPVPVYYPPSPRRAWPLPWPMAMYPYQMYTQPIVILPIGVVGFAGTGYSSNQYYGPGAYYPIYTNQYTTQRPYYDYYNNNNYNNYNNNYDYNSYG